MNPYLLMAFLYLAVAALAAVDSALTNFTLLPWFNGIRWLRVHLITLGAVTQVVFGLVPQLVARHRRLPRPAPRLDIWLILNAGILALVAGVPIVNQALILTGGALVFTATVMLVTRTGDTGERDGEPVHSSGTRFYVAGLAYFLVGIIVGTGLWLGWSEPLGIAVPIEVHIHANNWGLLSLVFAGLLVDLYPRFAGRQLRWPASVTPIFWMMTLGALGLVLGPWLRSNWLSVPGLLLHLSATIWLLLNVVAPLRHESTAWRHPGMWHLVTSYAWILAPVLVAPLIIAEVPGFPGAGIESNAPQALIYGWVLQFSYALVPYLFRRALTSDPAPPLGGSWFSLGAVHLGGVLLWVGIFAEGIQSALHGSAYTLWALSLVPILIDLARIVRDGLAATEPRAEPVPVGTDREAGW